MARPSTIKPGDRFGRLTAVSPTSSAWNCVCDCGTAVVRSAKSLREVANPACRTCAIRRLDRTGTVIGSFTAVSSVGVDRFRNAIWKWQCSCGRGQVILTYAQMKQRRNPSCQFCENDMKLFRGQPSKS